MTTAWKNRCYEHRSAGVFGDELGWLIARLDGSLDWLDKANAVVPEGEDCGYSALFASIDLLVMGRNTFETVLKFPSWPFGSKLVQVLSHRELAIPQALQATVCVNSGSPAELCAQWAAQGFRRVYADGGITVQGFLAAGLLNEITITRIPVMIGTGIRLFGGQSQDFSFLHLSTEVYPFGFVQSRYGCLY